MLRAAAAASLLAACSSGGPSAGDTDTGLPEWPAPQVRVEQPAPDAEVSGEVLMVRFAVEDFLLEPPLPEGEDPCPEALGRWVPAGGGPLGGALGLLLGLGAPAAAHCPGDQPAGYLVVRVDGRELARVSSLEGALPLGELEPGPHLLAVEARWADGDAFLPPSEARVGFTLAAPAAE